MAFVVCSYPIEDFHNRLFGIAASCWKTEMHERPSIGSLVETLNKMLQDETATSPPSRDVGLECYLGLENQRAANKAGARGGSVIRSKGLAEAE